MPLASDGLGRVVQEADQVVAVQNVTINTSAGASSQSAAFAVGTRYVVLTATVDCRCVVGGTNPVATATTGSLLVAGAARRFPVLAGDKLAALGGTLSGTLVVEECA